MDFLKTFLERQPLLSIFLVIGIGHALGVINIRGSAQGEHDDRWSFLPQLLDYMSGDSKERK